MWPFASHHLIAHFQTFGSEDIPLFAVCVEQKGDEGRAIRIVFNALDRGRDIVFVSAEIHQTVHPFVPPSDVAHGHATITVTSTGFGQGCHEGFLRLIGSELRKGIGYLEAKAGG